MCQGEKSLPGRVCDGVGWDQHAPQDPLVPRAGQLEWPRVQGPDPEAPSRAHVATDWAPSSATR